MPKDCCKKFWNKIPDDVPVFTVVGWDSLASKTVRFWLAEAALAGVNADKLQRTINHIRDLDEYVANNPEKMKLPD